MENKLFRIENNILIEYYPQESRFPKWVIPKKHVIKIPDNVIEIAEDAFKKAKDIKGVIIPKSVKRIGKNAFAESDIETLIIEGGVEIVEEGAFAFCKYLSNVYLGNNITILKRRAFMGCGNITNILLPKTTEELYDEVFVGCNFLSKIFMHEKLEYFGVQTLPPIHYIPLNGIFTLKESFAEMYATEMCKKLQTITDVDFDNANNEIYNRCLQALDEELTFSKLDLMTLKSSDVYLDNWGSFLSSSNYKIYLVKNNGEVFTSEGATELLLNSMNLHSITTPAQLHEKLVYQIFEYELDSWNSATTESKLFFHSEEELSFIDEISKIERLNELAYIEMQVYTYSNCRDRAMQFDWDVNLYVNKKVLKYDFNERKYLIKKW